MFVYVILLHWVLTSPFEVCLLGIYVIVGSYEIFYEFFTLWATLVMHLKCRGFMWEFYEILCFLDHGWHVLGMRNEWPFTRVFESFSNLPLHHWWYDFSLLYKYGLIIIHSNFSLSSFVSHHFFPNLHSTFYPFLTYWYTFFIRYLLHIIHMFHWWFDYLSFLLFYYWHFLWLPLGPWLVRFFYALYLVHEDMGWIIWYLSLVSLHFFHFITLTYVTSHVLRPPWGHEIRCYLCQPLHRPVFGICLIYRCCPVSSSRRCFFDAWRWFSDRCRLLFHLMNDIWCCLASHSTMYQLSYWGIFPFHLV